MIPKFRAWIFKEKMMIDVFFIDLKESIITVNIEGIESDTGFPILSYEEIGKDCALMQSIGIKDKNGKEIYEGDIMEFDFHDIGKQKAVVYFNQRYASFTLKPLDNFQYTDFQDGFVLGNVYENPELLEDKQ